MEDSEALVTVIIPNYNHARYLPRRIESVLQQTLRDIDVLILDDYSVDNSREVIEHYASFDARIRVVYNAENSGSTFKQWNKGFALARSEYIWIAESDDYADPNFLKIAISKLDTDSAVGLVYCDSHTVDENNLEIDALRNFYSELDPILWTKDFIKDGKYLIQKFMSYRNIIPNASAVVIRKSVINSVGKADENFKINGDWVFWASAISNIKVAFIVDKLNFFRFHNNNVRSKTLVQGIALNEMVRVVAIMQRYGKPNQVFFDKKISELTEQWFEGLVLNNIPLKTNLEIFNGLRKLNKGFAKNIFMYFNKYFISNNLSGMRQFLGDGLIYKVINK